MAQDLSELSRKIAEAVKIGQEAAAAEPNDGGSANLDHVVIWMKGAREASLRKAGIDAWKGRPGEFHLSAPFAGQGQRRYAGVQAMAKSLTEAGVDCFVFYQLD